MYKAKRYEGKLYIGVIASSRSNQIDRLRSNFYDTIELKMLPDTVLLTADCVANGKLVSIRYGWRTFGFESDKIGCSWLVGGPMTWADCRPAPLFRGADFLAAARKYPARSADP